MHARRIFLSRVDGALMTLMLAPLLAAGMLVVMLTRHVPTLPGRGLLLAALLFGVSVVLWLLFTTRYTLDVSSLGVRAARSPG
jgi:hypothetical protein